MSLKANGSRRRWWLTWIALTALSAAIHRLAWVHPDRLDAGLSTVAESPLVKPASNALDVAVGPVWMAMAVLMRDWGVYSLPLTVLGCAIGSGIVLLVIRRLLLIRSSMRERRAAHPPSGRLDAARRRFLIESPMALAGIAAAGTAIPGAAIVPFDLRVRRYRVPISDLPPALDGLRAVFISDTHLGPRVPAAYISRSVDRALALKPDLILLGGDYVHAGSRYIEPAAALFRPLIDSGLPVVGVLGNHDWYNSRALIGTRLRSMGIAMVDNGRVFLDAATRRLKSEPPASGLCIAGVGDLLTDEVDVDAALKGVPEGTPRLLLSHNPDVAESPVFRAGARVDVMISGHTHGGQVRLPLVGPLFVPSDHGNKYEGGLVQGPAFPVIISRGVGMSICPVRLGVPPELVEITLSRRQAST